MTRELILSIIFDETICRLPLVTRHKDYVFQTIKAVEIKNTSVAKNNPKEFNKAYELANESWVNAQKTFVDNGKEFSNISFLKFMLKNNDWLMDYFNLKQKRLDKLYNSHDLSKHGFRSLQVYNEVMKQIDITLAQYNYVQKDK